MSSWRPAQGGRDGVTGLDVFDRTVHTTNGWLNELIDALDFETRPKEVARHKAYVALRVTLQTLRDRLTVEEVAHLGAQLPMLVRGFYYEGWDPTDKPLKERRQEEFLARMGAALRGDEDVKPGPAARAVFGLLARRITAGEIEDVKHLLPGDLRALWPAA